MKLSCQITHKVYADVLFLHFMIYWGEPEQAPPDWCNEKNRLYPCVLVRLHEFLVLIKDSSAINYLGSSEQVF